MEARRPTPGDAAPSPSPFHCPGRDCTDTGRGWVEIAVGYRWRYLKDSTVCDIFGSVEDSGVVTEMERRDPRYGYTCPLIIRNVWRVTKLQKSRMFANPLRVTGYTSFARLSSEKWYGLSLSSKVEAAVDNRGCSDTSLT
ncbi:hypothetical protein WN55_08304 [Dufourea novaeangliae]|uniref:Uncharacterized protein n=1 Tax=Dufourea novaeangliae TaxID=178035 RepID=A0A154P6T1_DUFNO|nr:hypothetical protein WN55_08304 [Dufourea novaeangliae]